MKSISITGKRNMDKIKSLEKPDMIFERNSICDSSYDVWKFDENGNLLQKENIEELGGKFFWKTKVIYNL